MLSYTMSTLTGSLVAGILTLAGSLIIHVGQLRAQGLIQEVSERKALYAEFIREASSRLTEAWSHQIEGPEVLAGLYSAIQRMRLTSSPEVILIAERLVRRVIEAYAEPDRTFDELRHHLSGEHNHDPLSEFSEACREELRALAARSVMSRVPLIRPSARYRTWSRVADQSP